MISVNKLLAVFLSTMFFNAGAQQLINASIDQKGEVQVVASKTSSQSDFDFLIGHRESHNRRLLKRLQGNNEWIVSTSWVKNASFLSGISNLDVSTTIRDGIPHETISLQVFNPETRLWSCYWVNGNTGMMDPPVTGSFEGNIGTFYGRISWDGKSVHVVYTWDKTNLQNLQWTQSYSSDNGKTWELNMHNVSRKLDDLPMVFEPGLISADSSEFGSAFSPDGQTFYFARSVDKRSGIYLSRKTEGRWSIPERASFSSAGYSDADPAFAPDGSLYFISTRPSTNGDTTVDYDIWRVAYVQGGWGDPVNVKELNSPENEFYISFTSAGDACFASSRPGGYGEEDIYISKYERNKFLSPVNVGPSVNTEHSEYDPHINADASAIIFASSGRNDSFGKADLYWSTRSGKNWKPAVHFEHRINTDARDYCPYVTRDGFTFFYSTQGDIKFMSTGLFPVVLLNCFRR